MEKYFIVLLGGAIGSLARYLAGTAIMSRYTGVLMNAVGETQLRAVTHYDVNRESAELAIRAIAEVASSLIGVRELTGRER
jgi:fluoride ion exporter CrcB/FEX